MFDELLEGLWELLKEFFCWALNFIIEVGGAIIGFFLNFIPDIPLHSSFSGFAVLSEEILTALNWVLPLGMLGALVSAMLTFYLFRFVIAPAYYAFMNLIP